MNFCARFFSGCAALIITLVGMLITSPQAAAKSPSSALMAPIIAAFNAFNAGNESLWAGAQTADVVILDNIAPYRWDAPNAAAKWWADFRAWQKTKKMTKPHVAYQAIRFWEQTGDRAYMVVPTTFTAVQNRKSVTQTGTLTFALVKMGTAWKVRAWTWGTTSMK